MKKILTSSLLILSICVFAATNSPAANHMANAVACDWDNMNESLWIHPNFALCSVHAYNIGLDRNPTDAGDIELMNEVVRLKATVIAQQMRQQYDFLEATIRRLETQLQRGVLTARLEAAGGAPSGTGGGGAGGGGTGLQGVTPSCDTSRNVFDCLIDNNRAMVALLERGGAATTQIRRQMMNDFHTYQGINNGLGEDMIGEKQDSDRRFQFQTNRPTGNDTTTCHDGMHGGTITRTQEIISCLRFMASDINNVSRAETRANQRAGAGLRRN